MGRKYFLIAMLSVFSFFSFAQDNNAYQKFLGKIVSSYKYASANSQLDFYTLLELISKNFSNKENPFFVPALQETKIKNNITERMAFDLLYENTMRDFRKDYLWAGAEDIYKQNKKLFELYSQRFCSCMSDKFKGNDAGNYREVFQICRAGIISDTTFLKSTQQSTGENTYNKLNEIRNFTLRYLYGNCNVLTIFIDDNIKKTSAIHQYYSGRQTALIKKGDDAIRFYMSNKRDSLKELFPEFENYIEAFKNIIAFEKSQPQHKITQGLLGCDDGENCMIRRDDITSGASGNTSFIISSNNFDAQIKSLSFSIFTKENNMDKGSTIKSGN